MSRVYEHTYKTTVYRHRPPLLNFSKQIEKYNLCWMLMKESKAYELNTTFSNQVLVFWMFKNYLGIQIILINSMSLQS